MRARFVALVAVVGLVVAACGGEASTCEEIADEVIELTQQLIDDVESELGDVSLDELLSGGELPSLEGFVEDSERIDARAAELGCSADDLQALIADRADQLRAETPVGEFILDAIRSGSL